MSASFDKEIFAEVLAGTRTGELESTRKLRSAFESAIMDFASAKGVDDPSEFTRTVLDESILEIEDFEGNFADFSFVICENACDELRRQNPQTKLQLAFRQEIVMMMRVFLGLSQEETAAAMQLSLEQTREIEEETRVDLARFLGSRQPELKTNELDDQDPLIENEDAFTEGQQDEAGEDALVIDLTEDETPVSSLLGGAVQLGQAIPTSPPKQNLIGDPQFESESENKSKVGLLLACAIFFVLLGSTFVFLALNRDKGVETASEDTVESDPATIDNLSQPTTNTEPLGPTRTTDTPEITTTTLSSSAIDTLGSIISTTTSESDDSTETSLTSTTSGNATSTTNSNLGTQITNTTARATTTTARRTATTARATTTTARRTTTTARATTTTARRTTTTATVAAVRPATYSGEVLQSSFHWARNVQLTLTSANDVYTANTGNNADFSINGIDPGCYTLTTDVEQERRSICFTSGQVDLNNKIFVPLLTPPPQRCNVETSFPASSAGVEVVDNPIQERYIFVDRQNNWVGDTSKFGTNFQDNEAGEREWVARTNGFDLSDVYAVQAKNKYGISPNVVCIEI